MTKLMLVSDVCELVTDGTHYTPKPIDEGLPFLTVKDVTDSRLDFLNCSKISKDDYDLANSGNSAPKRGDVLFSKDGTVGKVHVVNTDQPFAVLSSLAILRPKANVDAGYLGHALRSPKVLDEALKKKTGSAIRRIILSDLKQVRLPLPPLPEQRRIAAILDQADTLRAKRREALAQLDKLAQAIFVEMFGDPVTNSKGWKIVSLGEHVTKIGSGSTPTGGDSAYKESGISLIRSLNVHDGCFIRKSLAFIDDTQANKLRNVVVEVGDVLLNITGASVARVCRAPADVLPARVNQHVMIIRPRPTLSGLFLERLLLSSQMKALLLNIGGSGATREAITKAQAEMLPVICPPIELQNQFAERFSEIQRISASGEASLKHLEGLFTAIQHRAFRGEL